MSGGYRFLIFAAFGLSLLCAVGFGAFYGSIYAPEKRHYQSVGSNSGQTYPTDSPRNGLADVAGIDGTVESLIAKPQPRDTDEREQRDLAAQESMAVFAYWMFWAMILQTALAGGALIALMKDLRQNRDSAETQLRAYVDLCDDRTGIEAKPEWAKNGDAAYKLNISFKNFGATPARHSKFRHVLKCFEYPLPGHLSDFTLDEPFQPSFNIPPGGNFTKVIPWSASQDVHYAILAGTHALYIFCEFSYRDVFGDDRLFRAILSTQSAMVSEGQIGLLPIGYTCT